MFNSDLHSGMPAVREKESGRRRLCGFPLAAFRLAC